MRTRTSPRSRPAPPFRLSATVVHVAAVVAALTVFGVGIAGNPDRFASPGHLLWVGVIAAAELLPVPVWREARLDLSFPLSVAVAVLYEPPVAGLIAFVGSCDPREFRREVPWLRALFNRANIALSTALVSGVFHLWASADSGVAVFGPAAVLAAMAGYALNVALVATAMSLDYRMPARAVLRRLNVGAPREFLVSYIGFGLVGAVLAHLHTRVGFWSILVVIGPLLLARQAFFRSRQLADAEARYRALVEQIPAVTYREAIDATGSALYVSPQVEAMVGYPAGRWIDDPQFWTKIIHPDDRSRVEAERLRANRVGEPFSQEYRLQASDGRSVWVRSDSTLVSDDAGAPLYRQGVIVDITAGKEAEEQISFLAYHDKLTGLPNRVMVEEVLSLALGRARRRGQSVAVLYMDLDNFKLVNDSLGHAAGDELVRDVAGRLRRVARETDLVSRQGGDEFLIVLADLEGERQDVAALARSVAGRVHRALRDPFIVAGTEVFVSASVGISVFPLDAGSVTDLLRNADAAMFRSKKRGPAGTMMLGGEPQDRLGELSFITRLRRAVEDGSWVLHYQPIIDLREGTAVGVEALVRWNDPEAGLILPGRFIPLAEEMGLIGEIDDWVLQELCRQSREWLDQGVRLETAFNLSLRRLWETDMVERMVAALDRWRIDPTTVILEITETTAMADPDRTKRVLDELHGEGVKVAIDDFGTAHSSLSRLKQLNVDVLKIDQAFVRDAPDDPHAASMLTAIVHLAHVLGVLPLAEGIETEEQRALLLDLGCVRGQGFHFSPAVPPGDVTAMIHGMGAAIGPGGRPLLARGAVAPPPHPVA